MHLDLTNIPFHEQGGLLVLFAKVPDPRSRQGRFHPLPAILALAVAATLSGVTGFQGIADFITDLPRELRRSLGFRKGKAPCESAIRRLLQRLDLRALDAVLAPWLVAHGLSSQQAISIDGKIMRGSRKRAQAATGLLTAAVHGLGIPIAARPLSNKDSEIPKLREMLAPLPLEGCIVTADALHTQEKTARFLVEEKGADYLFPVKENQPTLLGDLKALDPSAFSPSGDNL